MLSPKFRLKEIASFFHQFSALLDAGLPVQQSLNLAGKDCSAAFQRSLQQASANVAQGQDLATAMTLKPPVWSLWTLALIQMAEYSGSLASTCRKLAIAAEQQQRRARLYRSVTLACGATVSSLVLLLVVLSQGSRNFLVQPGFWTTAGLLLAGAYLLGTRSLTSSLYRSLGRLPVLKPLLEAQSMLYFTELELPLSCGVPLLSALELIRDRIPNPELAKTLAIASQQIARGQTLSRSLQGKIPAIALQMIRTGEETGNLDEMLQKLAAYYEGELELKLRQLQGVLRPLSLLAGGAFVLVLGMQMVRSLLDALPG
ncbi:type II secretion system F family protein [Trichocoleus sp. FACHB-262]|uniref:type II secretion system F family protein n=1 Tax=Trichocoleus sp. FACHB-262 TaxID=2692869 RepID=UPI001689B2FB|nr:type II secretion system F family protein [Trichocoleus sp. FACHB-262]MBD2123919.1 type II secretion system F family protein [Trichocoleus sp. FACHB-262]